MAGTKGLEPSTSGVTGQRSKPTELRLRKWFYFNGGIPLLQYWIVESSKNKILALVATAIF